MENQLPEYYRNNYIATVTVEDGDIKVVGGPGERRKLRQAKRQTPCCYVRNMQTRSEMKLILHDDEWTIA